MTRLLLFAILSGLLSGQSLESHLANARKSEQAGDFATAEREYEKAIAIRPSAETYRRLGLIRHLENKYREAIPAFEQSLLLQPDEWSALLFLGMDLYRTNQFDRALAELKRAERLRPNNPDTRFWLGATYLARKEFLPGLEILERLFEEQPKNLEILRLLTENYAAFGTALLNVVGDKYPETPAGIQVHAQALEFEGANEAALATYRELDRIAPDRPRVRDAIRRLEAISAVPQPPSPPANAGAPPSRP